MFRTTMFRGALLCGICLSCHAFAPLWITSTKAAHVPRSLLRSASRGRWDCDNQHSTVQSKRRGAQLQMRGETVETGLRRPEQWRSRGEQSWKEQKEQQETLPAILFAKQALQFLSRVYFIALVFELVKALLPLLSAAPAACWSLLAASPGAIASALQASGATLSAVLPSSAQALAPALAPIWLLLKSGALLVVKVAVACGLFVWSSVTAAAQDLVWMGTGALKVAAAACAGLWGWLVSLVSSEAPGVVLLRQDAVFYAAVTVALRMMVSFYGDHDPWAPSKSPKAWGRVDQALLNLALGLPLAALLVATAMGGGRLLTGALLAYYLCVGVQVGMADLLAEELRSPTWTVVEVPFTAWRLVQLQALGPAVATSLAPAAAAAGGWGSAAAILSSAVVPVASAAWVLLCARHLLQVPAVYRWRRQPDKSDLETLEQLRTSVENLRLQTENLRQGRQRIRTDTWGSGTLEREDPPPPPPGPTGTQAS